MAKKKNKKLSRKQKKALKKAAGLQGKKVSKQELNAIAQKETQKKQRSVAAQRRYNNNKEYLEKMGVPTDIITKSTSIKETKKRAAEYIAKQEQTDRHKKQANLVARKINRLIDAGYTYDEASKLVGNFWRPASNKVIDQFVAEKRKPPKNENLVLSGKQYLYVGVCEIKDGFQIPNLKLLTSEEIQDLLAENLHEAVKNPDGSDRFSSVFQYKYGSKARMERRAEVFYSRGYDMNIEHLKLNTEQYQKITVSNKWSEHDFFSMFYTCTCQMKNEDIVEFNDYLKDYCKSNGFPFMDDYPYLSKRKSK